MLRANLKQANQVDKLLTEAENHLKYLKAIYEQLSTENKLDCVHLSFIDSSLLKIPLVFTNDDVKTMLNIHIENTRTKIIKLEQSLKDL